ncbi:DoxX family protein [Rhizobium sp. FKY42]|uniref:DoxX family protein n=1 Tax=Rhizobium sp. FKY42 TaxID=2562310 RepID=UPI0010C09320|nr:DoxX family protein [Rhizobium sp. FKY42]
MSSTNNALILVARIFLSAMFIMAGFGKLVDPAGTAGMIANAGFPQTLAPALAYLAGAFELVAGLAVLVGFQVKIVGWALAAFCLFTAFVFHGSPINVPAFPEGANKLLSTFNQIMMMKNITLAGAYLLLATVGAGAYSLDARRGAKPALA